MASNRAIEAALKANAKAAEARMRDYDRLDPGQRFLARYHLPAVSQCWSRRQQAQEEEWLAEFRRRQGA